MSEIAVRPAVRADLSLIEAFIRELAAFERLSNEVRFEATELGEHLFGADPRAEALIGEIDGETQGFALFFPTFSTFAGKPGLWLEDLFVRETARGNGLGKALLLEVGRLARERGCARLEWSVLDWNESAIRIYRGLGARMMDDWRIMRVEGQQLADFGGS